MAFPTLTNPDWLENSTREELESLIIQVNGYLSQEHKSDGSHGDLTADSVDVENDAAVGGNLAVVGNTTVTGNLTVEGLTELNGSLEVADGVAFPGEDNVTANATGELSSYGGTVFALRLSTAAAGDKVDGLIAIDVDPPQLQGRLHWLFNDTANWVLLRHDNAGAGSASSRLYLPSSANCRLRPNEGAWLWRDSTDARWRVIGPQPTTVLRPAQVTADQNNYSPTGWATADTVYLDFDAARNFTGFAATVDGDRKLLVNKSGFDFTISHNSASSSAGNKVICPAGASYTVTSGGGVLLTYDETDAFWRIGDK